MDNNMPVISAKNLNLWYGDFKALKGISRKPALWDLNHAAFMAGRGMQKG